MEFSMLPSEIRFSQDSIRSTFTHGDNVHDVIDDIVAGCMSLNDFLPIEAAYYNGKWFVENNRTLYVCRVLEYKGALRKEISVKQIKIIKQHRARAASERSRTEKKSHRQETSSTPTFTSYETRFKAQNRPHFASVRPHVEFESRWQATTPRRQEPEERSEGFDWGKTLVVALAGLALAASYLSSK